MTIYSQNYRDNLVNYGIKGQNYKEKVKNDEIKVISNIKIITCRNPNYEIKSQNEVSFISLTWAEMGFRSVEVIHSGKRWECLLWKPLIHVVNIKHTFHTVMYIHTLRPLSGYREGRFVFWDLFALLTLWGFRLSPLLLQGNLLSASGRLPARPTPAGLQPDRNLL